jgi:hypothetical protein
MWLKLLKLTELFSAIFTFFKSWKTLETVLERIENKKEFFKKIETFDFWSIFANFMQKSW